MLVVPGSAAEAAALAVVGTMQVMLSYPDRDMDVTSDHRTVFDLSGAAGMFEVDAATKQVRAVSGAGVRHCTISVSFAHEDVVCDMVGTITVRVADFVTLAVSATPSPSYSGSTMVNANLLSAIGGSSPLIYEAAALRPEMVLTNRFKLEPPLSATSFDAEDSDELPSTTTTVAGLMFVPDAEGTVEVRRMFAGVRAVTRWWYQ
jgi:hypothetical protein